MEDEIFDLIGKLVFFLVIGVGAIGLMCVLSGCCPATPIILDNPYSQANMQKMILLEKQIEALGDNRRWK